MAESDISGWAIRYNEPTTIGGSFIEKIAPAAFSDLKDVVLLWGHDGNRPLARTTSGTLQLRDSRIGLWFSATLDPENPDAAIALSSIGRSDTRGMSFGFIVRKEAWTEPATSTGLPVRTVLAADLLEVSAVTWPAYPQSDVSLLRSANDESARRRIAASRRRAESMQRMRGIL
jgi:HK97 family phage prohead protease